MKSEMFCVGKGLVLANQGKLITDSPFDLEFPVGKISAIIGPNGAGKTTLLKALLGEPTLFQGSIQLSSDLSYVPQEHLFQPSIRLIDFLRLAYLGKAGLFGSLPNEDDPEIAAMLVEFGLKPLKNRSLDRLSTGERQRAFLARAVLQKAGIVILDEPTNHLDPGGVRKFWSHLIEAGKRKSFEIIVSTHDLSFVEKMCDWVCVLKSGKLFFLGSVSECFSRKIPDQVFDF